MGAGRGAVRTEPDWKRKQEADPPAIRGAKKLRPADSAPPSIPPQPDPNARADEVARAMWTKANVRGSSILQQLISDHFAMNAWRQENDPQSYAGPLAAASSGNNPNLQDLALPLIRPGAKSPTPKKEGFWRDVAAADAFCDDESERAIIHMLADHEERDDDPQQAMEVEEPSEAKPTEPDPALEELAKKDNEGKDKSGGATLHWYKNPWY